MITDAIILASVAGWTSLVAAVLFIDLRRLNAMIQGNRVTASQPLLGISRRICERYRRRSVVDGVEGDRVAYLARLSEEFRRCIRVREAQLSPYVPLVKIVARELGGLPCAIFEGKSGPERAVAFINIGAIELGRIGGDLKLGIPTHGGIEEISPLRIPGKATINFRFLAPITNSDAPPIAYLWIGLPKDTTTTARASETCALLADWCVGELKLLSDHLAVVRECSRVRQVVETSRAEFRAIVHDLQSPIMTVRTTLRILDQTMNTPEQQELFKIASSAVESLRTISKSFLAGGLNATSQACVVTVVTELVAEMTVMVRPGVSIGSSNLERGVTAVPGVVLRRIVENVVSNAVKYTESGRIDVSVTNRVGHIEVAVKDSGIGMSPDQAAAAFQSGTRFSTIAEGHGIGLFGTQQLARSVGATIEVVSTRGSGTLVRICFPVSREARQAPTGPRAAVPQQQSGILVVDDDRDCAESLARVLKVHGVIVTTTSSVQEALEIVRGDGCRAVLFDLGVLRGAAESFVTDLLAIVPGVKIGAISGMFRDIDQYALAAAGVTGCFLKPIEAGEVIQWVGEPASVGSPGVAVQG